MDADVRVKVEARQRAARAEIGPDDIIAGRTTMSKPEIAAPPIVDNMSFAMFIAALDDDTRAMLSSDELHEIYEKQVERALSEKKSLQRKAAIEIAGHAARMATGLVPTSTQEAMEVLKRNNRIVPVTIELPPSGEQGEVPDIGLRIDQRIFLHGFTYNVTEAQAASIRETLFRVGEMELMFRGQNSRQRRWLLGRAVGGVDRHIPLNPDGSRA